MIDKPEVKLRQIRELKNLTQEYVANALNLTTRAYSKIESGETQLTINRLNEISKIFDAQPLEILGFDDTKVFNFYNSNDINGVKNINLPDKLIQQFEKTIQVLEDEIVLLKSLIK